MAARKTKSTKKASTAKHAKLTPRSRKRSTKPVAAQSVKREATSAFQHVRGLVEGAFAQAIAAARHWLQPTRG